MSWIDSVVAAVSPERAYRREAFRQAYEGMRSGAYDAGSRAGGNRNWRVGNESAELTDRYDRDSIRARARDLERNSDIMNAVTGAFKRNIVGGGYHVQAKTGDAELNKRIEAAWKKWCKKQNCDVTGTQCFNQIIRMAVERKKIDGGIIFIKRYTADGFVPFKLQMVEVDELDAGARSPKHKGNRVVGGIEYNSYNKPVGYWFRQYDLDGYNLKEPIWVDAQDVIFYFTKSRPSQLREMSDMASTIPRVRDVNEFITAVSVKQRIEACLSVFIKKTIPSTGIGRKNDTGGRVSYEGKTLSPGMIKELNAGDEVQAINPSGQSTDATTFTKLLQRLIGAGKGISYEATSRDMAESTYSSARQGLIEDDLTYKEDKELLLDVMDEIYETFLISADLCGALDMPGFWEDKEIYLAHEWVQEPKPWIDPYKESNANMVALKTGQKTFKQIAAENGKSWREQIDDMAEVLEYGEQVGVDMGAVLFGFDESSVDKEALNSGDEEAGAKKQEE